MTVNDVELLYRTGRLARARELCFADLVSQYASRQRRVRAVILTGAWGATITAAAGWSPVATVLGAVAAGVTLWSAGTDLDGKLLRLSALSAAWADLRLACDGTWAISEPPAGAGIRARELESRSECLLASNQEAAARWCRHVVSEYGPF